MNGWMLHTTGVRKRPRALGFDFVLVRSRDRLIEREHASIFVLWPTGSEFLIIQRLANVAPA